MKQTKYGLITSITMLIGVVIGSGIFFKSDNILAATGGNVWLGVLVFGLAAFSIVFGSLSISELATRTSKAGGVVTYAEEFVGHKTAAALGWYQTFVYYPTIIAVVATVVGIYSGMLFGFSPTPERYLLVALATVTVIFAINILAPRLGAGLQNGTTLIKLIPLFLVAFAGIFWGNPDYVTVSQTAAAVPGLGWLSALGPIAFSFDGWIATTSISHEIKNAKRNVPIALCVAPLVILISYVLYFLGINMLLGTETIIEMGDAHIHLALRNLLGEKSAKAFLIFLVISVIGTTNGMSIAHMRSPYALAIRKLIPGWRGFAAVNEKNGLPVRASLLSFVTTVFWLLVHYLTQKWNLMPNSDVSEISITLMYVLYLVLYFSVFRLYRRQVITSPVRGIVLPLFASLGSVVVVVGGVQNTAFIPFALLFACIMAVGVVYSRKNLPTQPE